MIRKHYIFHGRVQGVGFRYTVYQKAVQLGLTGWVKNLNDGNVEACLQGEKECIDHLIDSLHNQRFIHVEYMDVEEKEVLNSEHSFDIKYY
ncbi:acylphosphatase [Candidatus Stoquefichus sp. SB1]|uniref:acylphosphatase n=1 Tax=Candidatus Stoquefichus sp. SB1 TaxID=1658109 RepID=UPI00067EBD16|nr:acylphosphatase [Candidatus Stoquefichus sp. SB1]